MQIELFDEVRASSQVNRLSDLLSNAIEHGALVGYVLSVDVEVIRQYWRGVTKSVAAGERLLICCIVNDEIVGTVQLYLSPETNAPHRGEVYKLLVHSSWRNHGIGQSLMLEVERQARHCQRSLLLLDTVVGGAGERLYRRLGWQQVGIVPRHFVDPWGKLQDSVYMMRFLD